MTFGPEARGDGQARQVVCFQRWDDDPFAAAFEGVGHTQRIDVGEHAHERGALVLLLPHALQEVRDPLTVRCLWPSPPAARVSA